VYGKQIISLVQVKVIWVVLSCNVEGY